MHPLAWILKDLVVLNNIFILSAPWIVSPTKSGNGASTATVGLHPFICASAYAIAQPVCLAAIIWMGTPMWIALLAIPASHCIFADFVLGYWIIKNERTTPRNDVKVDPERDDKAEIGAGRLGFRSIFKSGDDSWLYPALTAAGSDAALTLLGAELYSYQEEYDFSSSKVSFFFTFFALAIYIASRFVDHQIATTTNRRGLYGAPFYTRAEWQTFLGSVAYLYTARIIVAWIVERYTGYPLLRLAIWPRNVKIELDRSHADFLLRFRERWPWASPLMSLVAIPMQFIGSHFLRKAAREEREKAEKEQQAAALEAGQHIKPQC